MTVKKSKTKPATMKAKVKVTGTPAQVKGALGKLIKK